MFGRLRVIGIGNGGYGIGSYKENLKGKNKGIGREKRK